MPFWITLGCSALVALGWAMRGMFEQVKKDLGK